MAYSSHTVFAHPPPFPYSDLRILHILMNRPFPPNCHLATGSLFEAALWNWLSSLSFSVSALVRGVGVILQL